LLKEFVADYYHPVRTNSSLVFEPPVVEPSVEKPLLTLDADFESKPILGGLYHRYKAKAA
jgi:hypothetical protein